MNISVQGAPIYFTIPIFGGIPISATLVITWLIMAIVTAGYGRMDAMDMVWSAVSCLTWEAVLLLIATIAINLIAMANFDAKGEYRPKTGKPKNPPQDAK